MSSDRPAPLQTDTLDLARWLLERLAGNDGPVERRVSQLALQLLEETALALRRTEDRWDLVDRMDVTLVRLRAMLRLAEECGKLDAAGFMGATERIDRIGNQIGGWKRRMQE